MITKKDITFITLLLLVLLVVGTLIFLNKSDATMITIKVDNEVYGTYDLNKDQTIYLDLDTGYNTVEIKNKEVTVSEASCFTQVCVNSLPVSATQPGSIVCLPHGVVIELKEK